MARRSSTERKSNTSLSSNHPILMLNSPAASCSPSPEPQLPSISTMAGRKNVRRSPQADASMHITYTPTTHRISKAKKGKRVHACEFPGCNKVFTRAEHRRRHELNHNPEASYRCTETGCKKAFHRPDLLARHMERHELESQPEQSTSTWAPQSQASVNESTTVPHCVPIDRESLLAVAPQQPTSTSIGSLVASGVHPDLSSDCALVWNGVDLPLQQGPSANLFQNHLPESAVDSPFYSSPAETCPSPLSDATFSLPSHSSSSISSISSASVSAIDQYPENILKNDLTTSPLPMHSPLRWDSHDGMSPSHLVPISLEGNLIQPPVQCHYPSPPWSSNDCLSYEEQVHSLAHFQPMSWKHWAM